MSNDGKCRCIGLKMSNPLYVKYHDTEWCRAKHNDQAIYELFILELFQAGLSWELILKKRENFRRAYDRFDLEKVIRYGEKKIDELMNDKGIIRNRAKIEASIVNSRIFKKIQDEYGSFERYIWGFTDGHTVETDIGIVKNDLSDKVAENLTNRGVRFAGSVSIFSFLQSIGVINSHTKECFCYKEIKGGM